MSDGSKPAFTGEILGHPVEVYYLERQGHWLLKISGGASGGVQQRTLEAIYSPLQHGIHPDDLRAIIRAAHEVIGKFLKRR